MILHKRHQTSECRTPGCRVVGQHSNTQQFPAKVVVLAYTTVSKRLDETQIKTGARTWESPSACLDVSIEAWTTSGCNKSGV